ncbi:ABC transporter permease [Methanotorris formicicus]|uniref:Binding-protein-dependent transport systems inner membrane component n=1 Tax=Methanotorris formicicus Mc-S-70 TaxID=647171 RepID=H1KZZ1_9EURY|nr:ABC transporter permease [Methanotorris formicicus]EHP85401.1 binding-protein-dependent transport systems inner membrane component [Methanotorris formicicus Mc-S-70]
MEAKRKIVLCSLGIGIVFVISLFSPHIFKDVNEINFKEKLQPPSLKHPFGTDNFGRDLLERTLCGLRISLILAVCIEIISLTIGISIGLIAGYYGGIVDEIISRVIDTLMAFPNIIFALTLIAILGQGMVTLILALSLLGWIGYARIIRSEVLSIKENEYVLLSKAVGGSDFYIMIKHILPNAIMPLIPLATLMIGHSVLSIAGLSFLGLGVQPPTPELGLMLKESMTYMDIAPWLMIFPGLVLSVCVLLFNTLGDALRDLFDPRKREMW